MEEDSHVYYHIKDKDILCKWVSRDGTIYYDEESIIAALIIDGALFIGSNLKIYLNISDVFAWAYADAEDIEYTDIAKLFDEYLLDQKYYHIKFACKKRNEKPICQLVDRMKKDGCLNEEMEKLSVNKLDEYYKRNQK